MAWNDTGKSAGLPENVFIKSTPLSAKNRVMVGTLDMAVNEVRFYDELAPALGDVAPRAWYARAGCGARFLMVLEHLVAEGGRPYALADPCPIDHARGLIDAFARLHSTFWDSSRFATDLDWVRPWSTRPGSQFLNRFYSRGRHAALKLDRPEAGPAAKALVSALDGNADAFYRAFETGPLTLLHGDSHLGNTFSRADGRSGLLDWQVIWRGPGMREVTYWMVTGLEPGTRRAHERELIDRYLDGLRSAGTPGVPDAATAFDQYRVYAAEAWDATAMTIAWPGLQAPDNAEAGWRRACIAIEDLHTADAVSGLR